MLPLQGKPASQHKKCRQKTGPGIVDFNSA